MKTDRLIFKIASEVSRPEVFNWSLHDLMLNKGIHGQRRGYNHLNLKNTVWLGFERYEIPRQVSEKVQ